MISSGYKRFREAKIGQIPQYPAGTAQNTISGRTKKRRNPLGYGLLILID